MSMLAHAMLKTDNNDDMATSRLVMRGCGTWALELAMNNGVKPCSWRWWCDATARSWREASDGGTKPLRGRVCVKLTMTMVQPLDWCDASKGGAKLLQSTVEAS
ncbi:hypothetical protein ABZP36_025461 [Zizania latifolia]